MYFLDLRAVRLTNPKSITISGDNFQTLHRGPGDLVGVATMDDPEARFLHRISVKGAPSWELPRADAETWLATHVAGGYRTEWLA